jgi:hypothetical protein
MIDIETCLIVSVCVVLTYTAIKLVNRLFDRTDKKKKNSLF